MVALAVAKPAQPSRVLEVVAADGTVLAARQFPASEPAVGAVVIVPAMGVPQSYYAPFAQWLQSIGCHAITFDYRGSGLSRRGSLRGFEADVRTWAEQDTEAVVRALADRAPGLPITWIGHSLGGQIIPFVPAHALASKVITVAAGSGYWRQNAAPLRRKVWIFWFGAVPLLTPLFGYFPGKRLGMVGDLPRGVIRQWRRWCLDPEYAVGAEGPEVRELFSAVALPITALSFTDDEMMSEASTRSLHGFYTGAAVTHRRVAPADLGVSRIGHFGAFKAPELWPRLFGRELVLR
jgi:predicted alpha/beta hydrolase